MNKIDLIRNIYSVKPIKKTINFVLTHLPTPLCYFGNPLVVGLEITNVCNLRCPVCPHTIYMKRSQGMMTFKQFKFLIDDVCKYTNRVNMFGFGEPFVNKDIFKMIKYAKKKGIYIKSATNSTLLYKNYEEIIKSGLDEIVVSLDGFSKEAHEGYRVGSSFDNAKKGIILLCNERDKRKSKIKIELQSLVTKLSEDDIPKLKEFAKQYNMFFSPKSFSLGTYTDQEAKQNFAKKYLPTKFEHRYSFNDGEIDIKKRPLVCMWVKAISVLWNGDVNLCCYDSNGEYIIGNIFKENGLMNVYKGKEFKRVRKKMLSKQLDLCSKCQLCGE